MPTWICLLRAINLGKTNKVAMPVLREIMATNGFREVRTYLQSGNVVSESDHLAPDEVSVLVGSLVARNFGVTTPVVVRRRAQLTRLIERNPFRDAALQRPKQLHVYFLETTPSKDVTEAVRTHALTANDCHLDGCHLYVDHRSGVAGSKLTPQFLDRLLGVSGTARNWRTVLALEEMAK
ncbi:MAG: DUF1697 domain-containing protein [Acidimicrobiales bacterium]